MKQFVHQRQSPNWLDMTKESFFSQNFDHSKEYWRSVLQTLWPYIEEWDRTCQIKYFPYRNALKTISSHNLDKLNVPIVKIPPKETDFLVSIDDDDWLHPNLFEIISPYYEADVVIWKHTILWFNGFVEEIDKQILFTNNFALTKSGIEKLSKFNEPLRNELPFAINPRFPHYDIHRRIIKTEFLGGKKVFEDMTNDTFVIAHIPDQLSITNKSLASASVLMEMGSIQSFQEKLKSIMMTNPKLPKWVQTEKDELMRLNLGLGIKVVKLL